MKMKTIVISEIRENHYGRWDVCRGMAEIKAAVDCLDKIDKLYLLHCVSQYPTDDENINLRAMLPIKDAFPERGIGFSDHSRGIDACLAAVALGAWSSQGQVQRPACRILSYGAAVSFCCFEPPRGIRTALSG